ncbi:MAG: pyrroline-5-carboxylate reductase [Anaerolineae bacterium]|nr:pyrroline-5-carboxylate reductase [Thermoflexales bacterium]MDW8408220.1 pyrroline-5-carboxylate reductase [Anaerolineae bacterium]
MLDNHRIALIGGGVMGEAITKSLLRGGLTRPDGIIIAEPLEARRAKLADDFGVHVTASNIEAVSGAQVVILSVKPQIMSGVLRGMRGHVAPDTLVISIAAGVSIRRIAEGLGDGHPIVRAMPNTPAQIGEGITGWTCTPAVTEAQREQARVILQCMGKEVFFEDEHYLDMVTAISGTGPAYVFLFMEALIDVGVHLGFSRAVAEYLVMQTVKGSVDYAIQSGQHVAQLRNQVTSPAGTTAEALYILEEGGLRTVLARAVWAAYERSVALGKKASE